MLIVAALFLSGVLFTVLATWLLFKRRILFAGLSGTAGLSFLSISIILTLILLNIHTYIQLTSELKLAEVEIGISTQNGIPVKIQTDQFQKTFFINAKEWQLDARFLKWKSWAYLIGSEPVVRLESLTERRLFKTEMPPERYDFERQFQVLSDFGSTLSRWIGIVDTYYGSAVYMPAAEGAVYTVSASISGLVARAENKVAREAVTEWMNQ